MYVCVCTYIACYFLSLSLSIYICRYVCLEQAIAYSSSREQALTDLGLARGQQDPAHIFELLPSVSLERRNKGLSCVYIYIYTRV